MRTVTLVHPSGARKTCREQAARVWMKSGWTPEPAAEPDQTHRDAYPSWGLSPEADEDETF